MSWGANNPPGGPLTAPYGRIEAPDRMVCQHTGEIAEPARGETQVLEVKLVLEAVMCSDCGAHFGVPKWFDNVPFVCPLGHRNNARPFGGDQ